VQAQVLLLLLRQVAARNSLLPASRLQAILPWAREHGVPEIYVMDPCFNNAAAWRERLKLIASLNQGRIPLHTEIRLESIDASSAALLAEAGFRRSRRVSNPRIPGPEGGSPHLE